MNSSTHEFVTVDMRGLKAALVARARTKRCSVSAMVRDAVARDLRHQVGEGAEPGAVIRQEPNSAAWIKISVRLTADEVHRIDASARAAGLSRGAYLAGLSDAVPVLSMGGIRPALIQMLGSSCSELATISRNIHQLAELLRIGDVLGAMSYKQALGGLDVDVRSHLRIASEALVLLRPPRRIWQPSVSQRYKRGRP